MGSPAWEDLSEFLNPDEFAQTARIIRQGQDVGEVLGVYDNPTDRKELGDFTLDETAPRFLCAEPAGLAVERGDVLDLDGVNLDVIENPRRDGTGLVVIELAEVAGSHVAL